MGAFLFLTIAAVLEIAGCFYIHRYTRLVDTRDLLLGIVILLAFGITVALAVPSNLPRAFVNYAGVYLMVAFAYAIFTGMRMNNMDLLGVSLTLMAVVCFYLAGRVG